MTIAAAVPGNAAEPREMPFGLDEISWSRTDDRGMICAGNTVFQRMSGHDWGRLIGVSHRVIRHPDMPGAVFWLLWQAIRNGRPQAVYIKNRSQGGGWHWVLAVVLPFPGGYLSARIKPTSALFARVQAEYEAVAALEIAEALTPEQAAAVLLGRIAALGFADHSAFMSQALISELSLRGAALGRHDDWRAGMLAEAGESLAAITRQQGALLRSFEALQIIPTNMRIVAARLEPLGGPISAISDNYKIASAEITRHLAAFARQEGNLCARTAAAVAEALFLSGCARLQSELVRQFRTEPFAAGVFDPDAEMALLSAMAAQSAADARAAQGRAAQAAAALHKSAAGIRRMMLGLDSIRVMGRVESGRLRSDGAALSATIDQLDARHADIRRGLEAIMTLSSRIDAGMVQKGFGAD